MTATALTLTLTDNGHSAPLEWTPTQVTALQRIAGRTLAQLQQDGVFVFPKTSRSQLSAAERADCAYERGYHDDPQILTLSASAGGYQLHSTNLMPPMMPNKGVTTHRF